MRLVGIDYGLRRVGLAVTDPLQLIATPLKTVATTAALEELKHYVAQEPVAGLVLGWPLDLSGRQGPMTRLVAQYTRLLQRHLPGMPLFHYDERLTSVSAQKSLWWSTPKRSKRRDKSRLDALSASIMLNAFLYPYKAGRVSPCSAL